MCVLCQAIDKDRERRKLREQQWSAANPVGTNDLEFESKQKAQDSNSIYEGLCFNLESENGRDFFAFLLYISLLQEQIAESFPLSLWKMMN